MNEYKQLTALIVVPISFTGLTDNVKLQIGYFFYDIRSKEKKSD